MRTYHVRERNGEFWVASDDEDETSVYYIRAVEHEGRECYQITRDWWINHRPGIPIETEGLEIHVAAADAGRRLKQLIALLA